MADKANAVYWFEIPVTNLDRAKSFYEKVLQLELTPMSMTNMEMLWFQMEQDAPGATGTLIKADGYTPSYQGTLVYLSVEDIEATLQRVDKSGGKTLNPKMSIGEYGFVGHFEDCEGNRVALHSRQ